MPILKCHNFPEYDCCETCHEDEDHYGLHEIYDGEKLLANVCCKMANMLNDKGLDYVRERYRGQSNDVG